MAYDSSVITSISTARDDAELLVTWTSTAPVGTYYHVYIDRHRIWCGQGLRCKLPWPSTRITIDVGAVATSDISLDLSASLPAVVGSGNRASLAWLGGSYLDATGNDDVMGFRVYASTTAGGSISYTAPVGTITAYDQGFLTDGFGVGGFGQGGFGRSASSYSWKSDPLTSGVWNYAVRPYDAAGNESTGTTTTITISGPPRPPASNAAGVRLTKSYNAGTRVVTLSWLASPG